MYRNLDWEWTNGLGGRVGKKINKNARQNNREREALAIAESFFQYHKYKYIYFSRCTQFIFINQFIFPSPLSLLSLSHSGFIPALDSDVDLPSQFVKLKLREYFRFTVFFLARLVPCFESSQNGLIGSHELSRRASATLLIIVRLYRFFPLSRSPFSGPKGAVHERGRRSRCRHN